MKDTKVRLSRKKLRWGITGVCGVSQVESCLIYGVSQAWFKSKNLLYPEIFQRSPISPTISRLRRVQQNFQVLANFQKFLRENYNLTNFGYIMSKYKNFCD